MTLWPWLILIAAYGACVGSFLNVVILRLPAGKSLVHPPSHDPATGERLKWWENIPIASWLALRGRSRYTGERISVQYPLVEAFTMLSFAGLFVAYYYAGWRPGFFELGWANTWPAFVVHITMVACLIAATVIDAKLFIIPLSIAWTATLTALAMPAAVSLGWMPADPRLASVAGAMGTLAAAGGLLGVAISVALLWTGVIPRSFEEDPEHPESDDPETFVAHPAARREVLKEFVFLLPPMLGILGGAIWGDAMAWQPTGGAAVLGGTGLGYLVGGGLIWGTRVLGTLAFGKEAMGLGDVHLLAAVGAVLGAQDATFVYFFAPFFGLLGAAITAGVAAMATGRTRVIPYGPYLAAAAVALLVLREPVYEIFDTLLLRR